MLRSFGHVLAGTPGPQCPHLENKNNSTSPVQLSGELSTAYRELPAHSTWHVGDIEGHYC